MGNDLILVSRRARCSLHSFASSQEPCAQYQAILSPMYSFRYSATKSQRRVHPPRPITHRLRLTPRVEATRRRHRCVSPAPQGCEGAPLATLFFPARWTSVPFTSISVDLEKFNKPRSDVVPTAALSPGNDGG